MPVVNRSCPPSFSSPEAKHNFFRRHLCIRYLKFAFIAGLTFLVAAEVAYGQAQAPNYGTNDPGIQQRMQNQEQRIDQGVTSGALTPKETGRLEAEQAKIQQTEQRMKSDGQLTGRGAPETSQHAGPLQQPHLQAETRSPEGEHEIDPNLSPFPSPSGPLRKRGLFLCETMAA